MKKICVLLTFLFVVLCSCTTFGGSQSYPIYGETDADLSIIDNYVDLLLDHDIIIEIPDLSVSKLKDADWIYTEIAKNFYLTYVWYLDGSKDSFTLEMPIEYAPKDEASILLISYYLSLDFDDAESCFNKLRKNLIGGNSKIDSDEYSIFYAEDKWNQSIRIERNFESVDPNDPFVLFEKQGELNSLFESTIKRTIKDFEGVEYYSVNVVLEKDKEVKTAQVRLAWDYENGVDRTKTMIELFSNDVVVAIHNKFPELKFDELWVFWETPYVVKTGVSAKLKYISIGDSMMFAESTGPLYDWY